MRRRRVYARAAAAVGVLTLTLAAVSQWVFDNRQLVGATLLIGGVLFLWLALSTLGSSVSPRDRGRAGSINFGKRD